LSNPVSRIPERPGLVLMVRVSVKTGITEGRVLKARISVSVGLFWPKPEFPRPGLKKLESSTIHETGVRVARVQEAGIAEVADPKNDGTPEASEELA
jgi:hypothetical protein